LTGSEAKTICWGRKKLEFERSMGKKASRLSALRMYTWDGVWVGKGLGTGGGDCWVLYDRKETMFIQASSKGGGKAA